MTDAAETILYSFADQYQEALRAWWRRGEPSTSDQDARWWALIQQAGGLAAGAVETLVHRATSSTVGPRPAPRPLLPRRDDVPPAHLVAAGRLRRAQRGAVPRRVRPLVVLTISGLRPRRVQRSGHLSAHGRTRWKAAAACSTSRSACRPPPSCRPTGRARRFVNPAGTVMAGVASHVVRVGQQPAEHAGVSGLPCRSAGQNSPHRERRRGQRRADQHVEAVHEPANGPNQRRARVGPPEPGHRELRRPAHELDELVVHLAAPGLPVVAISHSEAKPGTQMLSHIACSGSSQPGSASPPCVEILEVRTAPLTDRSTTSGSTSREAQGSDHATAGPEHRARSSRSTNRRPGRAGQTGPRVRAGDDVQHERGIGDGPRDRPVERTRWWRTGRAQVCGIRPSDGLKPTTPLKRRRGSAPNRPRRCPRPACPARRRPPRRNRRWTRPGSVPGATRCGWRPKMWLSVPP